MNKGSDLMGVWTRVHQNIIRLGSRCSKRYNCDTLYPNFRPTPHAKAADAAQWIFTERGRRLEPDECAFTKPSHTNRKLGNLFATGRTVLLLSDGIFSNGFLTRQCDRRWRWGRGRSLVPRFDVSRREIVVWQHRISLPNVMTHHFIYRKKMLFFHVQIWSRTCHGRSTATCDVAAAAASVKWVTRETASQCGKRSARSSTALCVPNKLFLCFFFFL